MEPEDIVVQRLAERDVAGQALKEVVEAEMRVLCEIGGKMGLGRSDSVVNSRSVSGFTRLEGDRLLLFELEKENKEIETWLRSYNERKECFKREENELRKEKGAMENVIKELKQERDILRADVGRLEENLRNYRCSVPEEKEDTLFGYST